jgi:hypothetical protein
MRRFDRDRGPGRFPPERQTADESVASPDHSGTRSPSPPPPPVPPKLVLSLADGPEALNRAFLRMRRISDRDRP